MKILATKAQVPVNIPRWVAGAVFATLLTLIVGAFGQGVLLYSSAQVTNEKLSTLNKRFAKVEEAVENLREISGDRWSRSEHDRFAAVLAKNLSKLGEVTATNAAEIRSLMRAVDDLKKN